MRRMLAMALFSSALQREGCLLFECRRSRRRSGDPMVWNAS